MPEPFVPRPRESQALGTRFLRGPAAVLLSISYTVLASPAYILRRSLSMPVTQSFEGLSRQFSVIGQKVVLTGWNNGNEM